MKDLFLICLVACTFSMYSQNNTSEKKKSFVIFEGCEAAEDIERCYTMKLQDFIASNIDEVTIEDAISSSQRDTISVHTSIRFNSLGNTVPINTKANSLITSLDKKLYELIHEKLPKVKPAVDSLGNPINLTVNKTLGFSLNREQNKLVPIYDYKPNEYPFYAIDEAPIYPGCESQKGSNNRLKRCMDQKIGQHIGANFNADITKDLKLPPGKKTIRVSFLVDKNGDVTNVKARGPHPVLEKEAERVIKLIPKMISPPYYKNTAVDVRYALPIAFVIN